MDDATVDNVAEMLLHDKIICVCQGESHVDLRALGNRSILYLPNRKYAHTILMNVKLSIVNGGGHMV